MSFRVYNSSKSLWLGLIISLLCVSSVYGRKTKEIYKHVAGHRVPNANLCPHHGQEMKVMIFVASYPEDVETRMGVRHTWAAFAQRRDVGLAFVVALPEEDKRNVQVRSEIDMYGDMILASFVDSYRNKTLKTVSMLEWVEKYCSGVQFVMKTEDYVFINVPQLLKLIEEQSDAERTIFGKMVDKQWLPVRDTNNKYYLSVDDYPQSTYPTFIAGRAYLLTRDTIHDLYKEALNSTFLQVEDVMMTGVVPEKIGVKRIHIDKFKDEYVGNLQSILCLVQNAISIDPLSFSANKQFAMWEKLHDTSFRC